MELGRRHQHNGQHNGQSRQIALKVDCDTFRGTQEGVTALLRLFDTYQVRATFLFSVGKDHTGRALRRVFRPGFLSKVSRTSVVSHYGLKTLMYGVLLPGPHIGKRCHSILQETQAAGHETGIHCHDHVYWQDYVAQRDAAWTRQEMDAAKQIYEEILEKPAHVHGAAGWQINPHVLEIEQAWGLPYASDTRGDQPFLPMMIKGAPHDVLTLDRSQPTENTPVFSSCVQLPTTLPTLDELLGADGVDETNVHKTVLTHSRQPHSYGHVYTLHAELEGMKLLPIMERLLKGWQAEGYQVGSLANLYAQLQTEALPCHQVVWGRVPGRSGMVAMQGEAFAVTE